MEDAQKRRMMEEMPEPQLLWKMAGPSMAGVMAYNLYNIFDTLFVSQGTGASGVGGIAVSFPLFIFLSAVSSTLGSGAASVISRALGKGDINRAAKAAANTFALFYATALLITVCGLVWLDELLMFMGVTQSLMPYARAYTRIILLGAVTSTGFSSLIRAEGSSRYAMYIWVIPMCANIVLDSLFIFALHMGVTGAAVGTVAAQCISMGMSIYYFFISGKSVLHIQRRHFAPDFRLMGEMISIGLPSFLQMGGQSVALVLVNRLLKIYSGDMSISAYGIVNKIIVFISFPIQGLAQGLAPVIGYNKGADKYVRTKKLLKTAAIMAGVYGIGAFLAVLADAEGLMGIFTGDPQVQHTGSHILVIVSSALVFSGIQTMETVYFQAAGKKALSLFLALLGQVLCFIPSLLVLANTLGQDGIWYAFPVSAFAAFGISTWAVGLEGRRRNRSVS